MSLQFMLVFILLFFAKILPLEAIQNEFSEDRCRCYRDGAPISAVSKEWDKLQKDVLVKANMKLIPNGDLFEHKQEYNEIFSKASTIYKKAQNECRDAKVTDGYYYPSDFDMLFEKLEQLNSIREAWDLFDRKYIHDRHLCNNAIHSTRRVWSRAYDDDLAEIIRHADYNRTKWMKVRREIFDLFELVHTICLRTHGNNLRSLYEYGLSQLLQGNYSTAMYTIKKLIAEANNQENAKYLSAELFLELGIVSSMAHKYSEAVEALNTAIEKDPKYIDAHIERAIAYFELGDFDAAINEYLENGLDAMLKVPSDPYKLKFGKGLIKGASSGAYEQGGDAPVALLHSIQGIGQLLWACIAHPIDASQQMTDATHDAIDFLRTHDNRAAIKKMAPELHELLQQWDTLEPEVKGEKVGIVLGKYGIDLLVARGAGKAFTIGNNLRKANAICNLGALASKTHKAPLLAAIESVVTERKNFFGKTKIHPDKQGKHIQGHRNFQADKLPSVLTHQNPEALLKQYSGKGVRHGEFQPGKVGFKEVIECDEIIGEFVVENTAERLLTRRATIHYDKAGAAHIVPAHPKGS